MSYLFEEDRIEDLQEAVGFYAHANRRELEAEQIERIIVFGKDALHGRQLRQSTKGAAFTNEPIDLLCINTR